MAFGGQARIVGEKKWNGGGPGAGQRKESLIDASVPNAARAGDYLLGGRDNFDADRRAVRAVLASAPVIERIAAEARDFRRRVVRFLAADAGIGQFLDIGNGLVPPGNTHELAQAVNTKAKIVYADSDPMVLSHARALLRTVAGGAVTSIDGDVSDVPGIIKHAADTLDFDQPVAVLLMSTLAHVLSADAAAYVVSGLTDAVPSGSYLVIYHLASDIDPAMQAALKQWNRTVPRPITLRSRPEIAALVAGLELVPPGVVPVAEWRPDLDAPCTAAEGAAPAPLIGVVARKP
jgi:hypothetical protein